MAFPDGSVPTNANFLVNGVPFSGTGFGVSATGSPPADVTNVR